MQFTCSCCGYKTLSDYPGSYEICPICFWEDDPVQILGPWYEGGANRPSLVQAQLNYQKFGACEEGAEEYTRKPLEGEVRDFRWRMVNDSDKDKIKSPRDIPSEDWRRLELWYYWLATA